MMDAWSSACALVVAALIAAPAVAAPLPDRDPPLVIAGSKRLEPLAEALGAAFSAAQPHRRVATDLRGPGSGVSALAAGIAQVAIVERPAWESERRPFHQILGGNPVGFRIGIARRGSHGLASPGVYVNGRNPLRRLSAQALERIYTSGAGRGDIVRWGQLGLTGRYDARRIHLYGGADDGGFATNFRLALPGKHQFAPSYETPGGQSAVIEAVRDDPYGIAVLDEASVTDVRAIKRVAIEGGDDESDPFTPYIRLYVAPSTRHASMTDAALFVSFALSPTGQRIVARYADALDGAAITRERARFGGAADDAR